jgi:hypothetical protein
MSVNHLHPCLTFAGMAGDYLRGALGCNTPNTLAYYDRITAVKSCVVQGPML